MVRCKVDVVLRYHEKERLRDAAFKTALLRVGKDADKISQSISLWRFGVTGESSSDLVVPDVTKMTDLEREACYRMILDKVLPPILGPDYKSKVNVK